MGDPKLAQFVDQKYISLETFKKNGQGVKTPVWFVLHNDAFYVYTEADSWKVKRIHNNPRVRVAVCNIRGNALSTEQLAAIQSEGQELLTADVAPVLSALSARVDAAVAELRTIDVTTLGNFRGVGRAQLPSTVIGCLVHGAEHAMRHVGQLSVTARIVRSGIRSA